MLARAYRLPLTRFFAGRKGRKTVIGPLSAYRIPNELFHGRLGVIVKKEHVDRATERHLLRRRIISLASPTLFPGEDVCIVAGKGTETLSFAALRKAVYALLQET